MRFEKVFSLVLMAVAAFVACSSRQKVLHPKFPGGGLLAESTPADPKLLAGLDGRYAVRAGGGRLGESVVVRSTRRAVSVFAAKNAAYAVLETGCLDGGARLVLEGYYRYAAAADTGLVRLFVEPEAHARALCGAGPAPSDGSEPSLSGESGEGEAFPDQALKLVRQGALSPIAGKFMIVGHRAGCRTIDDCGASENSLELIRMAEGLGSTAIELDAQLTKDGVPVLFHDEYLSARLVNGNYCRGRLSDHTFAHLRALCSLEFGEQIPTVDQALASVRDETDLEGVWLDVKAPSAVGPVLELAAQHVKAAQAAGRKLQIAVGLGTEEVLEAFRGLKRPDGPHCVVELEPDDVRETGCHVWAPRWTRGPSASEAKALKAEGHAVVYWTIDELEYIDLFLREGRPNGMLSNRPGLLQHRVQSLAAELGLEQ
jgi:glycerophosphoryl diester phosphodiesterase